MTLFTAGVFAMATLGLFWGTYHFLGRVLDQDVGAELREEIGEYRLAFREGGLAAVRAEILDEAAGEGPENYYARLFDPAGRVVLETDRRPWGEVPLPALDPAGGAAGRIRRLAIPARPWREARLLTLPVGGGYTCQVALPAAWDVRLLNPIRNLMAWGTVLALALALPLGWFVTRRGLRPVEEIRRVAADIAGGGDLSRRVPEGGARDEPARLAATFNAMLGRIEALLRTQREMLDNVAHDLRTPITRIRAMAETALAAAQAPGAQEPLAHIMEECDRCTALFNALLDLSEAEAGLLRLRVEPMDVGALLGELAAFFGPAARDRGIELLVEAPGPGAPAAVAADRVRLRQALANLLENAIRFTPPGGRIRLWAEAGPGGLGLLVQDSGPGVPPADRERIFRRFTRGDPSRAGSGRGLGLALARAYVEAHGGRLTLEEHPGPGARFRLWLPLRRDGDAAEPAEPG
ncbi:HAMP domain-containing histidine kinase [Dissulfurirhabdus thermomarina]|uniref:histidine kinase n=2 Tax=Dissulfurirhabdus thermomarina TaxID=1765737 RepID=A0A6N9TT72_DISTH|nr:HAMP domain-containing sensor histidine kinase [Dissulfurirhabdus thermomarina]NDY42944.1 HAMP domain-containing histidine kinase [Dissulfurirhabdus thermomarina]